MSCHCVRTNGLCGSLPGSAGSIPSAQIHSGAAAGETPRSFNQCAHTVRKARKAATSFRKSSVTVQCIHTRENTSGPQAAKSASHSRKANAKAGTAGRAVALGEEDVGEVGRFWVRNSPAFTAKRTPAGSWAKTDFSALPRTVVFKEPCHSRGSRPKEIQAVFHCAKNASGSPSTTAWMGMMLA